MAKDKKKNKKGLSEEEKAKLEAAKKLSEEEKENLSDEEKAKIEELKAKEQEENEEMAEDTVKMIWIHKRVTPGSAGKVFAFSGIANEDGFFVVDVPKKKVKNEMKRRQKLVPLKLYLEKKKLDEESASFYDEE